MLGTLLRLVLRLSDCQIVRLWGVATSRVRCRLGRLEEPSSHPGYSGVDLSATRSFVGRSTRHKLASDKSVVVYYEGYTPRGAGIGARAYRSTNWGMFWKSVYQLLVLVRAPPWFNW